MNRYFFVLNWILLAMVIAIWHYAVPCLQTKSVFIGAFLAAMMCGGLVSWQYYKDSDREKKWKWRKRFFYKNYHVEVILQLIIALAGLAFGEWFWRKFHIITGFAITYAVNLIIEWSWAKLNHYGRFSK